MRLVFAVVLMAAGLGTVPAVAQSLPQPVVTVVSDTRPPAPTVRRIVRMPWLVGAFQ